MRHKTRVRMHLYEPEGTNGTPSVEGVLVGKWGREYVVALPQLLVSATGNPAQLESRHVRIPRANVMFYEVLA